MKTILFINKILFFIVSLLCGSSPVNVVLYNFSDIDVDKNNELVYDLSSQISENFIHLIKKDVMLIDQFNFQSSKEIDKTLDGTQNVFISMLKEELENGFMETISRDRFSNIINSSTNGNLNEKQIAVIADSLIFSITGTTKDIAKDMFLSNVISPGEPIEISTDDMDEFISINTQEKINRSEFIRLLNSTNFLNTDYIITSYCKIRSNEVAITLHIYNFDDFSYFGTVVSKNSPNKTYTIIKDLEFSLMKKLGLSITDDQGYRVASFDLDEFSSESKSLYCTNIFSSQDISELAKKIDIGLDKDFINNHYSHLFNSLRDFKDDYTIKLNNDDSLYRVLSINAVKKSSVRFNVKNKSNWVAEDDLKEYIKKNKTYLFEMSRGGNSLIFSNDPKSKRKSIIEVNFSDIDIIEFR